MAAVLKAGKSLKKVSMTPLITKLKEVANVNAPLARLSRDVRTEEMSEEDAKRAIFNICGEEAAALLNAAGKGVLFWGYSGGEML